MEAYSLNPASNLPYTGSGSTSLYPLAYATAIVNQNPTLVAETAADGSFRIPTSYSAGTSVTVEVRLEKRSVPQITVEHEPAPAQTLKLSLSQSAGTPFLFTAAAGRAFNMARNEVGTAQVAALVYSAKIAEFCGSATGSWSPPYGILPVADRVNIAPTPPCDGVLGGYFALYWSIHAVASLSCPGASPSLHRNSAYSTLLYHEYGHHFTQNLFQPGAVHLYTDEIFADVLSAYYTGDPVILRNIYGTGTARRDISEVWIHPVTGTGDPLHDTGRPHTGSMWELRESLISSEGVSGATTANQLFFEWLRGYRDVPTLPPPSEELLYDLLVGDDNLFGPGPEIYDPPHGVLIVRAFGHHNLLVPFSRGDANVDGSFDVSDPIITLQYLYESVPILCEDAADSNDDGVIDISDPSYSLAAIFTGGPVPPPPYPACGTDAYDSDELFCVHGACH